MVILDENSKPILVDSINAPLLTSHFWVLDLEDRDFKLQELQVLEEHITPMLVIEIYGYAVELPADWNALIISSENSELDVAEISELSRGHFQVMVYDHSNNRILAAPVKVIEYEPKSTLHMPSISKHQMLCHALGPKGMFCISPIDNYNKYLKGAVSGDLIY